ncbi:MAG: hypothetical protein ABSG91_17740 [Syntrophobacteraceae bacterium]
MASTLVVQPKPAEIRTAISRAYYAIFNMTAQFLVNLGFTLPRTNVHVAVQHRLQNCADMEMKKVGSQLTELHNKRIQADYRLNEKSIENQKTALTVISQVDRMMQLVENCTEPRQQLIIRAIQEWENISGNR